MSSKEIQMDKRRLRAVTLDILEAIRMIPSARALSSGEVVIVQAYVLGVCLSAASFTMSTLDGLASVVKEGYDDFQQVIPQLDGEQQ